ncbi:MAG: Gfo/Idh/MocA family oxidoreductase [Planctomycetota bacterium]|nr:Gfo/Idh/MocA family oxidoreductase [Planctomycetota bacterium]MDA1137860.1 Gfo/Idh/MocA family oxidoreductase [Planctomycetota bacterium]
MATKPIKTAVLALGRSGWNIHVNAQRNDERFTVVSVMDLDEGRRKQAEEELGCDSYTDLKSLLKKSEAEVIVVATPSFLHGPNSIEALKSGRHVIVEKPMSATLTEADRMIAAAEKNGVHLFVHQNYRFNRNFTFMRDVIKSRKLGKLTHIGYISHGYSRRNDWQCLRKFSGGLLNNKITHPLDQLLALVDSPIKDILCDLKHISDAGDVEDHVKMLLRAENGVTIDVEDSSSAATVDSGPEWTLLGTCGAMTIRRGEAKLKYYDPKKAPKIVLNPDPMAEGRQYGNKDTLPWQEEELKAVGVDIGSYYDAVYATLRRKKKFPIDPRQVREMMRVLSVCRKQNPDFPGK